MHGTPLVYMYLSELTWSTIGAAPRAVNKCLVLHRAYMYMYMYLSELTWSTIGAIRRSWVQTSDSFWTCISILYLHRLIVFKLETCSLCDYFNYKTNYQLITNSLLVIIFLNHSKQTSSFY